MGSGGAQGASGAPETMPITRLVTPIPGRMRGLLGVALLAGVVAILALVLPSLMKGEVGHAVVRGPSVIPGKISLQVVDGPRPATWSVSWDEPLVTGQRVEVRLRGSCGCVPYPPSPPVDRFLTQAAGVLVVVAAFGGFLWLRTRRIRTGLERARALVVAGARGRGVRMAPAWTGTMRRPELQLIVILDAEDAVVRVPMWRVDRNFDPTVPHRLIGDPIPGGTVALVSRDGDVALSAGRVEPVREGWRPHEANGRIASILGWRRRTEDLPAEFSTGRVSVSPASDLSPDQRVRIAAAAATLPGRLRTAALATVVGTVAAGFAVLNSGSWVLPASILALVALALIVRLAGGWANAPLVAALVTDGGLERGDARFAAACLLRCGFGLPTTATATTTAATPAPGAVPAAPPAAPAPAAAAAATWDDDDWAPPGTGAPR